MRSEAGLDCFSVGLSVFSSEKGQYSMLFKYSPFTPGHVHGRKGASVLATHELHQCRVLAFFLIWCRSEIRIEYWCSSTFNLNGDLPTKVYHKLHNIISRLDST